MMSSSFLLRAGAISAASAVAFGAFGAHGLKGTVTAERHKAFETAAHYQLVHSVALCVCAALPTPAHYGAQMLLAGTAIFSGSIYALVLLDQGAIGAVTPVGGALLIAGWLRLAYDFS